MQTWSEEEESRAPAELNGMDEVALEAAGAETYNA